MDQTKDILGLLRKVIRNETLYLRHWVGKVSDDQDPANPPRGRVKASVPELGFFEGAEIWCSPRMGYSMTPPAIGEWVEIYFLGGDPKRPVYLPGVGEITGGTPKVYTGTKSRVLWQDSVTGDSLVYHEDTKEFDINLSGNVVISGYTNLKIGAASEPFVLGATLYTFFSSLMTWLGTHVHSGVTTGVGFSGPSLGAPSLPDFRSAKIKGE
jgi:phage baseplate assembly protein gpV